MNPEELVTYITALSIAIAKDKSTDELSFLSAFFGQLSATLSTISTQRAACEPKGSPNVNTGFNPTVNPEVNLNVNSDGSNSDGSNSDVNH